MLFDCHGEFEGFVLDDCCQHAPASRAATGAVADLVLRACRENLTVCVRFCPKTNRIEGLAIGA